MRVGCAVALLLAPALAACLGPPGPGFDPVSASSPLKSLCAPSIVEPCTRLAPSDGAHLEAWVATHPTATEFALLTWTERAPDGGSARVWASTTADGGRTWRPEELHDPALAARGYAFDSSATILPDGTSLVVYGGENQPGEARITAARSTNRGASWTYHVLADDARPPTLPCPVGPCVPHGWDYMQVASAPDDGHAFVVAPWHPGRGVALWRSDDGGRTWGGRLVAFPNAAARGAYSWPRVAAGPDGLVVVLLMGIPGFVQVAVSRDGGDSFETPTPILSEDPSTGEGQDRVLYGAAVTDKLHRWETPDREFAYPPEWRDVHYFPEGRA